MLKVAAALIVVVVVVACCLVNNSGPWQTTALTAASVSTVSALEAAAPRTLKGYMAFRPTSNPCRDGFHLCGEKHGGSICLPNEQKCVLCAEDEKKCLDSKGEDYCIPYAKQCPQESLTLMCPKGTKICRHGKDRHFCEHTDRACPDLKAAEIKRLRRKLDQFAQVEKEAARRAARGAQSTRQGQHNWHKQNDVGRNTRSHQKQQAVLKGMFAALRKGLPGVLPVVESATISQPPKSAAPVLHGFPTSQPTGRATNPPSIDPQIKAAHVSEQMDLLMKNLNLVHAKVLDQNRVLNFFSTKLTQAESEIRRKHALIRQTSRQLRREHRKADQQKIMLRELRRTSKKELRIDQRDETNLQAVEKKDNILRERAKEEEEKEEKQIARLNAKVGILRAQEGHEQKIKEQERKTVRKRIKIVKKENQEGSKEARVVKKEKKLVKKESKGLSKLEKEVSVLEQEEHPSIPVMNT